MREVKICTVFTEYQNHELPATDTNLLARAQVAARSAYAPYSQYYVGAALLLDDGRVVTGNNQENAAYPSGLCAERVALFAAGAQGGSQEIAAIAIAAYNASGFTPKPVSPCGACRQVLLEYEKRQQKPIRIILSGAGNSYIAPSAVSLMPLYFDSSFL